MMNSTTVPIPDTCSPAQIIKSLVEQLPLFAPQLRRAAAYIVENPNEVGISSIREIAEAALVKPNTLVRMARTIGFEGYDDFRQPFREEIRAGSTNFPDRARWLQSLSKSGKLGTLYSEMVSSAITNIESSFSELDESRIKSAADCVVAARKIFVLGAGINYPLAGNFSYLLKMAGYSVKTLPSPGGHSIDELAGADRQDVLIAMTFKPYREEVVQAVDAAVRQNVKIISISDSLVSPIVPCGDHVFTISNSTPQFFPSSVATLALLECLLAFIVADAGSDVVRNIERLDERRHQYGIYRQD